MGSGYDHLGVVSLEAYMRVIADLGPASDDALGMRYGLSVDKELNLNKIMNWFIHLVQIQTEQKHI